ncbi:hypothetical protein MD588_13795 [Photobacterium sp. SDRW27]|uniref:hypothetical protein n=1 Tax=Photobacterium obscurum TaxID=2829490 RepID=UPI002244B82D|nr:hypothetical protein [Photobacterium obscurum]MCW8329880.1 hypothetical protein [Photobacterium obscurum]
MLGNPETAAIDALRPGALYNYNMLAYVDAAFFSNINKYFAGGGKPEEIANQGFRPNLKKRGAIRSIFDGQYKFSRYFSPLEHHMPRTLEQLFAHNDVELFDIKNDPLELRNLALDYKKHGELISMMNGKLNLLIEREVGEDHGQMMPGNDVSDWKLSPDIQYLRL